jgi:hypothetical protein
MKEPAQRFHFSWKPNTFHPGAGDPEINCMKDIIILYKSFTKE